MSNIMISKNCNQKCSYCFASEFVNRGENNITFSNLKKAVDFILTDSDIKRRGHVGVIGGEPLLHPEFDVFMQYLIDNENVTHISVFTNGVLINEHINCLLNEKVGILININSAKDVGIEKYKRTEYAVDLLVNKYHKKGITLGLNIYADIDYTFFVDLAEKYSQSRVRLSIVVPAYGNKKYGINHFYNLKSAILKITKRLLIKDIDFKFDCNLPVSCIWNEKELEDLKLMGLCTTNGIDRIPYKRSVCAPVIDILPDLKAIRCFGLSDISKVDINDFSTIEDLRSYYVENYDSMIAKNPLHEKCNTCYLFPERCFGGCLANRIY